MSSPLISPRNRTLSLRILIGLILVLGIVLRFAMFFHNRNLIIDEANIVRNLAERGFQNLVLPLRYEQFAPPVFLWIEKLASLFLGYGEKAMRLYPLLCGLGALFVFPAVARRLIGTGALLLPLIYLAGGFVFLKYSAEVKQYMPDTFIALVLIWLALRWDIHKMSKWRFAIYWGVVGSIAIWSSMPSVFILAGIGCYYGVSVLKERRYEALLPLIIAAGVWLAQFALYYFTILKAQIGSSYLQNYHLEYFLYATPASKVEWLHNWTRIEDILGNVGGWSGVSVVSNLVFFLLGIIYLLRKRLQHFMLIALPIGLVLVAAALKQFSLIDRVILFSFPLWGLVIGIGLERLWNLKLPIKVLLVLVGGYDAQAYAATHLLSHPFELHEITKGMDWIIARGGRGNQLYVHDASVPTYIYYTELHPRKAKWSLLLGAQRLQWETDYAELTKNQRDTTYFLYTGGFPNSEKDKRTKQLEQHMQQIAYFEYAICYVYVYVPKEVNTVQSLR